jgi:hypothetical protein
VGPGWSGAADAWTPVTSRRVRAPRRRAAPATWDAADAVHGADRIGRVALRNFVAIKVIGRHLITNAERVPRSADGESAIQCRVEMSMPHSFIADHCHEWREHQDN